MKNNFKGWSHVYAFTFKQATKGAGFKVLTAFVTVVILAIFVLINILMAKPDQKEEVLQALPIEKVYVMDQSGLPTMVYDTQNGERFKEIDFVEASKKAEKEVLQQITNEGTWTMGVLISKEEETYVIEALLPKDSQIEEEDAEEILAFLSEKFQDHRRMQAGLSTEQLTSILKPVTTNFVEIGESANEIVEVIQLIAPMLFGLLLYIMLLLHGQTVSKAVSTEKTSKLVETLLTSIHPYALIGGKILAITSVAMLQFIVWVIAGVIGLYGGNALAYGIYGEYQNVALLMIDFLKENIGRTAFTPSAMILALVFLCVGFLFYCVIAGLAGCMVSKPEDIATTQAVFQFPVIMSWLICYLAPIYGNEGILEVARYIPFTSPFCVPVDLITGTVSLTQGIVSLSILLLFSLLTTMLAAKIYKGLILYNGQKVTLKLMGNLLRKNR